MKTGLLYIEDEFTGRKIAEFIENRGYTNIRKIMICGDRGSPDGYKVTDSYVIRSGDKATAFKYKELQKKS